MATVNDDFANGCTFQWKIENISQCFLELKTDIIISPTFSAAAFALEGTKWWLGLCPTADFFEKKYFGIFLHREDSNEPTGIEVHYKLAFLGKDGSVLTEKCQRHYFEGENPLRYQNLESQERIVFTEKEKVLTEDALTVECTILWGKVQKIVKLQRLYARTVFKVNRRSIVWRIENFSTLKRSLRNKLKDNLIDLDLVLNRVQGKMLDIDMVSFDNSIKYISFNTSIIDSEGKKENVRVSEYFADEFRKGIFSRMELGYSLVNNKSLYLPNDVLCLEFECVYSTETESYDSFDCNIISPELTKELVGKSKSQNPSVLIHDLKSMYTDGIFSDMELRTSRETFPAHKSILSARSLVFRRMFSNDKKESNSGHVDITDLEGDTVRQMLLYIYTDILQDLQIESACELYSAADKYEIMSLKSECFSFLKDNLCPSKACDVLIMADQHQDDNLKSAVQAYILEHDEVFNLLEWERFMETNLKLAADVMFRKVKQDFDVTC